MPKLAGVYRASAHKAKMHFLTLCLLCVSILWSALVSADIKTVYPQYARSADAENGAVATVHPLATQAAIDVLNEGGNAIDAAVAAALTLGVVDGHNSGIGGGNFALVRYADGTIEALDGRERAPLTAHRDMYIVNGEADSDLSQIGALAIGVPGSLAVYDHMQKASGTKSMAALLERAADLAEKGFPLSNLLHNRIHWEDEVLQEFPASAAIYLDKKGEPWPVGHQLVQKDLAETYRAIARHGIGYFYGGDFAKTVEQWMVEHKGLLRVEDFKQYSISVREPVVSDYRGYQVVGFPPPSSGGVHVAQILNMLAGFDIASLSDADRYHLLLEAMKLAFADRAHFLGDPDFVDVPKGLINPEYAKQLAAKIDMKSAAKGVQHGHPPVDDGNFFTKHTTHISTADKWGNWVSITTTVNTPFGSKVIIPGTGVLMNNQMDDFSIQPGVANAFGLVGREANSVQPGKRPLSSMSPTLVLKDGKPMLSVGAAGGPMIITQVVQALVNILDLNMSAEQALSASRVHHQWLPNVSFVEGSMPEEVVKSLEQRGHEISFDTYGDTQAVMLRTSGKFESMSDPRVIEENYESD